MAKKKYHWDEETDRFIRQHYDPAARGRAQWIAGKLSVPRWAVNRRARDLGLSHIKDKPWSPSEIEYLHAWFHRVSAKKMAKHLGRSVTAVKLKAKRLGLRKNGEGYTASALAEALGVDPHWVTDRIKRGMLMARYRHTERTDNQGGDSYLITDQDFLSFVEQYPYEVNLRKVDACWFMDLVAMRLKHHGETVEQAA